MANVNSVVVSGNLTRDPELKHLPSGTAVAELGIAVNRSKKNEDGSYDEEVSFFDVSVFGKYGELVARKLKKGDSTTVQGELRQDRWQNGEGENRSKVVIIARQLDSEGFFRSKDEENATEAPTESASQSDDAPAAGTPTQAKDDIPF